ncbi:MAG TPA: family 16 glycoside hydrolase [Bacteroidota bacterium]
MEELLMSAEYSRPFLVASLFLFVTSMTFTQTIHFDDEVAGVVPSGWTATKTGRGNPQWSVTKDETAPSKPNVLRQSGVATFPICIKDNPMIKNGFVEVRFKAVGGKEDQAGGIVWRCQGPDNYYVARANALEDNVCVYYVVNGRRTEKKRASVNVSSNEWHTLHVEFNDNHFVVTFNGKKAIEWDDNTIKEAGKVGLWTKADSETLFDDFSYGGK